MINFLILAATVFLASFIQGAAGFGLGLIAMPIFVRLLGIQTAAPLMSLLGTTVGLLLLIRYRSALNFRAVMGLAIAAFAGIPVGIYLLTAVDSMILIRGLGVFVLLYVAYTLFTPTFPTLRQGYWTFLFGFLSGLFTGAYAIGGPPVIVYANAKQWQAAQFKSNLQAFFLATGIFLLLGHALSGNFTDLVWRSYGATLPLMLLGLIVSARLDHWLTGRRFHHVVLFLIFVLGLNLLHG